MLTVKVAPQSTTAPHRMEDATRLVSTMDQRSTTANATQDTRSIQPLIKHARQSITARHPMVLALINACTMAQVHRTAPATSATT